MEGKLRCQGWERRNGKEGKRYVDTVGSWERWNREGEGTMGRIGKRERKWKLECFGLERGKERREGEVRIRVGMDFVYCWWMVRCLDPRSALVSHGNVLVWKERFGNEVGGKAGCVAVGVGGWTLDSLIL
jgi:hypothetical protein